MKSSKRVSFTSSERQELWQRWRHGESLSNIGRSLERHAATIYDVLRRNGGYSPAQRHRSAQHLSLSEREEIFRGIILDQSFRHIAKQLGRAPSTISREVNRNGGRAKYRVTDADS